MQQIFSQLVDSYLSQKIGIVENFMSPKLAKALTRNLLKHYSGEQMHDAGTGQTKTPNLDKLFRGDKIFWLDKKNEDESEDSFFLLLDEFISYLNSTCYTGITGYEFHYTLYEAGSFYKRHIDQFQHNTGRAYSMILYLNEDWVKTDGGELCVYLDDTVINISPTLGKSVFFKSSELAHEVLITNKPRLSITGWLKQD